MFLYVSLKETLRAFINLSRPQKRLILYGTDTVLFLVAFYFSFFIVTETLFNKDLLTRYYLVIFLIIPLRLITFQMMGVYRGILKYTHSAFIYTSLKALLASEGIFIAFNVFLRLHQLPRSIEIINFLLSLCFIVAIRLIARWFLYKFFTSNLTQTKIAFQKDWRQPVIIYGAGQAGFQLSQSLRLDNVFEVVAFVDDNSQLWRHFIEGIKIFDPVKLPQITQHYSVNLVLLAIPSASPQRKQAVVSMLTAQGLKVKTIPTLSELISGKVSITQVRDIEITDILGRPEVLPDPTLLSCSITDKVVLVTGAGGSIGSELCRQIAQQKPKQLILFELNEFALYSIDIELRDCYPDLNCVACLGSVTDAEHLQQVLIDYSVETIYHAAAYKHVPLVEINPTQGIINNVYGTWICTQVASQCQVETFVLISTDKAVRPTNIMGATKRVAELILQAFAQLPKQRTRFIMVRFGNVLNSTGSVVPRFQQQIKKRQPITLTHPEITRYFMSIPEAARLVIQAGAIGAGGEVFLLDMGEPVKIYDLAKHMIELSGLVLGKDIDIEITGLRPGEKLYEELLIQDDKVKQTCHPKIYGAQEATVPWEQLEPALNELLKAARARNLENLQAVLKHLVPEYQPKRELLSTKQLPVAALSSFSSTSTVKAKDVPFSTN
ncbi:nucleoside-diphosphate sugar epimerase/dehydratase [Synechocystis sp. LKSZ1]|uniref:polysaccharide biosynthesis protein n=1 Tax=Synechocystis sp. LKSZ1 TaxID=3144951 RepID=UPI00336BEBB0